MSSAKTVFLIGSGLIGGEVLNHLLEQDYKVSVLTRRSEAAAELQQRGASAVLGTLADADIITEQAAQHEILIHTATADDLPSVKAVLAGITKRVEAGQRTIYIHTSGASVLTDDAMGAYQGTKIYYDDRRDDIDALDDDAPHRAIDLAIVRASKTFGSAAQLAILMPPLVYGIGSENRRLSIQLPTLTRFALHQGYAGHVGRGESVITGVHVADLATGYMTLLHALQDGKIDVLQNPYFFCTNGQDVSWRDYAEVIGKELCDAGKIASLEAKTIPKDKFNLLFGPYTGAVVGLNSRSRGRRLEQLGWRAKQPDSLESLRKEIAIIVKEDVKDFGGYTGTAASGRK